jgi:hypothetical protein
MAFGSSGTGITFGADRKEIRRRPKRDSAPAEKRFGTRRNAKRRASLPQEPRSGAGDFARIAGFRRLAGPGARPPALRIAPETRSEQARASIPTGFRFRLSGADRRPSGARRWLR